MFISYMQATVKQFAQVLQFVLAFDEQKLKNPSIQNDFSYYRRTLSRLKMTEAVCAVHATRDTLNR